MPRLSTLALLGLLTCAAAAPAPTVPTGEWLLGPAFPAAVYEGAYGGATTDTARLLLRPDGQYTLTDIEFTYVPGFFGSYVVTCGSLTVTTESGRYQLAGNKVTFKPGQARWVTGLSPQALNAGCKRSEGRAEVLTTEPYRGTVVLRGAQLSVSVGSARRDYLSRSATGAAAASQPTSGAPTPSPVPATGAVTPSRVPAPPAGPLITPQPWSATGDWEIVLELPGQRLPLLFHLYDDGERSLSGSGFAAGEVYVAWLLGSRGGTFDIGLDAGTGELKLKVEGRFSGDTFKGSFRALDDRGQFLADGVLTMRRQ